MVIFHSIYKDPDRPDEKYADQLGNYFWTQLDKFTENILFLDYATGRQWKGQEIKSKAAQVASYLSNVAKLPAESHCIIMYENCGQAHCIALGLLFAGSSTVGWPPTETKASKIQLINSIEPMVLFCDASNLDQCLEIRRETSRGFVICVIDDNPASTFEELTEEQRRFVIGYQHDIMSHQVDDMHELPVQVSPDHAAFVLMTSGSTGKSKPVIQTHRNCLYRCFGLIGSQKKNPAARLEGLVFAAYIRLEVLSGIFLLSQSLSKGAKLILMDGYNMHWLLDAIDKHQVNIFYIVNPLLHQFITECLASDGSLMNGYDLSSLRHIIHGGSKLISPKLLDQFREKMGDRLLFQGIYGTTETGGIALESKDKDKRVTGTCGFLMPFVELKLLDLETEEEIDEFECRGEICVRGPRVSPGYLGQGLEDQYRASYLPDGFYRTGDVGEMLSNNQLVIHGRRKELIYLDKNFKLLPSELESIVMEMPQVQQVAVVGIPRKDLPGMHKPRAFVVLKPESKGSIKESDVEQYVAARTWEAKQLTGGVRFMDELPMVPNGKVDKIALRSLDGH